MTYTRQELASLGKRASDLHRQQGMQLDDAVVKVASTEKGLTDHHVTRITENANLITFEEMFKEADSKHVVFDLADPAEVNNIIKSKHAEMVRPSSEYYTPPSYDTDDGGVFEPSYIEKESSYLDINHEYEDKQFMIKLNSAINHIQSELNRLDSEAKYATYMLADMVKAAAKQQNELYPVLQVMGSLVEDEEVFSKVAHLVVGMSPEIPAGSYIESAPNYNHPIAHQYVKVEQLTKEASRHTLGIKRLTSKRSKMLSQARLLGGY